MEAKMTSLPPSLQHITEWSRRGKLRYLSLLRAQERMESIAANPTLLFEYMSMKPEQWQADLLNKRHAETIICNPRQTGKSQLAATMTMAEALTNPGSTSMIISRSQQQADEVMRKVKGLYYGLRREVNVWDRKPRSVRDDVTSYDAELKKIMDREDPHAAVKDSTRSHELNNGSRIMAMPCSAETVGGYTLNLLIIDEAARVPDDLYFYLRPMLAKAKSKDPTAGRLVALSTPFGKRGWFFEAWDGCIKAEAEGKPPPWHRVHVKIEECSWMTQEMLDRERAAIGDLWYKQEYQTEFLDVINSLFSYADIQAITDPSAMDPSVQPLVIPGVDAPLDPTPEPLVVWGVDN